MINARLVELCARLVQCALGRRLKAEYRPPGEVHIDNRVHRRDANSPMRYSPWTIAPSGYSVVCILALKRRRDMAWTRPKLREICIGLEINGYLPAKL
jgi:coenzyme PQQ precursor peptide PqqA